MQVTALGTVIVGSSATLFAWHGARGQLSAAALHPPVMYCLLVALLLLPANFAYKVVLVVQWGSNAFHSHTAVSIALSAMFESDMFLLCCVPERDQHRCNAVLDFCGEAAAVTASSSMPQATSSALADQLTCIHSF